MRRVRNEDELFDQLSQLSMQHGPQRAVELLESVLSAATDMPPDVTRATLLGQLGEYRELAGDIAGAGAAYRAAVEDGGQAFVDPRAGLVSWCLLHGDEREGRALADQVRRSRPADPTVHLFIGEAFEEHGDLSAAMVWFTAGMRRANDSEWLYEEMAIARYRARRAQGFPPDEDDELALETLATRREFADRIGE